MAIPRGTILKRREKLEKEKLKHAEKIKALEDKMKAMEHDVQKAQKAQDERRAKVIGKVFLNKYKDKAQYHDWLEKEILPFLKDGEKKLFQRGVAENA